MTGYGESTLDTDEVYIHVMIKTVNSKNIDIDAYLPRSLAHQEMIFRKLFSAKLKRGKVLFYLTYQLRSTQPSDILNEKLLKQYLSFLYKTSKEFGQQTDLIASALRLPGVLSYEEASLKLPQEHQDLAQKITEEALVRCVKSREEEGTLLLHQLQRCITQLHQHMQKLFLLVEEQTELMRQKLYKALPQEEPISSEKEEEILTTLNKASVEEEKTRLKGHLQLFDKTLSQGGAIGKKLNFIIPELGRELKTLSDKSSALSIKHLVITMQELVQEMKEQVANIV